MFFSIIHHCDVATLVKEYRFKNNFLLPIINEVNSPLGYKVNYSSIFFYTLKVTSTRIRCLKARFFFHITKDLHQGGEDPDPDMHSHKECFRKYPRPQENAVMLKIRYLITKFDIRQRNLVFELR